MPLKKRETRSKIKKHKKMIEIDLIINSENLLLEHAEQKIDCTLKK